MKNSKTSACSDAMFSFHFRMCKSRDLTRTIRMTTIYDFIRITLHLNVINLQL